MSRDEVALRMINFLAHGMKPDEIASPAPEQREARTAELLCWFDRLSRHEANPKWLREHAFEIAYALEGAREEVARLRAENAQLNARLNTPELHDFAQGVVAEAAHQRARWAHAHDAGKGPEDWFWLLGYLAGKALRAAMTGDQDKALHHTISSAAALANWHAALLGADRSMRPGLGPGNAVFDAHTGGGEA